MELPAVLRYQVSIREITVTTFARIKHSAIWRSLHFYGIKPAYVRLLQRLYSQQEGTVLTDKEGDPFPIRRGDEAGGPFVLIAVQHSITILIGK